MCVRLILQHLQALGMIGYDSIYSVSFTGNCEQEIIKIDYNLRPREFYNEHIIPAMERTLKRCLSSIEKGVKRQIKQVEEYATYDGRIE